MKGKLQNSFFLQQILNLNEIMPDQEIRVIDFQIQRHQKYWANFQKSQVIMNLKFQKPGFVVHLLNCIFQNNYICLSCSLMSCISLSNKVFSSSNSNFLFMQVCIVPLIYQFTFPSLVLFCSQPCLTSSALVRER